MVLDPNLVRKLKSGDLESFNKLFDLYSKRIYAFGLKYLKNAADAEELVQDVFLKIWKHHGHLQEAKSLHAYIFTIAYHQIKDYFVRKNLYLDIQEAALEDSPDTSMEQEITYRSALDRINGLLEQLPGKKRQIFMMSRFEGKSAKEIALLMGLSSKTVDNQISEVIGFLRTRLKDAGPLIWLFYYLFVE